MGDQSLMVDLLVWCCIDSGDCRFKCDSEWNQRPVLKMDQRNSFDVVQSHTLRVGQVIKITCDSEFPADVVLLKVCFRRSCYFKEVYGFIFEGLWALAPRSVVGSN